MSMKKTVAIALFSASLGALSAQAFADKQPHMRSALKNLEQALNQLEKASHDKGGHRVKAIGYVKQAIDEVKAGIEFDNKH
jgi:hypothetical protein